MHESLMDHRPPDIDLGDDHKLWFNSWKPDRDLNPQYADLPDVERVGAVIEHRSAALGLLCLSGIIFNGPVRDRIDADRDGWTVESWEPLTLSPSLLCRLCGDHGFIREGRWVRA